MATTHLLQYPFGLINETATFMRLMHYVFRPILGKRLVVYLDEILVNSKNEEQRIMHLEQALQLL